MLSRRITKGINNDPQDQMEGWGPRVTGRFGWMSTRTVRRGELVDPELDLEYLADTLLAPPNVDLYYQRRVMGIPPERISAGSRR
jgi:hypothetical protein